MHIVDAVMKVHIAAGCFALATFLIPMVTAKGGKAHRRAGWVFVAAMAVLAATGIPVSIYRLATETKPYARLIATFLLYISVLSAAVTWKGMRVLRFKGSGAQRNPVDLGVAAILGAGGVYTFALGLASSAPILTFFGPLGIWIAWSDIRYWLDPNKPKMHWFFEHMGSMIGASIAALTAFSALGARALGLSAFGAAAWIAPTAIFLPVSFALGAYYRRKFGLDRPRAVKASPGVAPNPTAA
jgi:uncharacterized membrane protein